MPYGLGRRLRNLVRALRIGHEASLSLYPQIVEALVSLESAIEEHFPSVGRRLGAGRPELSMASKYRRYTNKLWRLRRQNRQLEEKLKALTKGKQEFNRITPEFLTKVAVSWPTTCARGFADAWRDLVGVGVAGCSRPTIAQIRDAFVEVLQDLRGQEVKAVIQSAASAPAKTSNSAASAPRVRSAASAPGSRSAASAPGLQCVSVLHIHDEASLRLRSSADTNHKAPSRSRSSKVQQHVIHVFAEGQAPVRWLCDLHPLADKSAKVLATSLHNTLRRLAAPVCEALGSFEAPERPWLIHFLVGDGIGTNEAAAKILWAWIQGMPLPCRTRYFLIVVKCASHQANLVIGSAVSGKAALVSWRSSGLLQGSIAARPVKFSKAAPPTEVCGAIVRLFKYLMSDYYSDYLANLQVICSRLCIGEQTPHRQQQRQKWQGLQLLYGTSVLPKELLDCLNGDLVDWTHCPLSAAQAPEHSAAPEERLAAIRVQLVEVLRKRLLMVDEQPTLTRMFTFEGHLAGMLLLFFLNCGAALLKPRTQNPIQRTQKRVEKVLAFIGAAETPQYLKRTALSMQLCGHIHGICAQQHFDDEPLLVRLAKGAVGKAVCSDLDQVISRLYLDPELDIPATMTLLLAVALEMCIRFQEYTRWPFQVWKLCRAFNSEGYGLACMRFLHLADEELDAGFGLPLRRLACHGRQEVDSINYLMSEPVQAALSSSFLASAASSLPVERAFAETKRSEAPRLCHVATASRNQMLRQHLRQRKEMLEQADMAAAQVRRVMKLNLVSLATELKPELGKQRFAGSSVSTNSFIQQNRHKLQAELDRRRQLARDAMERTQKIDIPVTQASWISWFREHEQDFREKMKGAGERRRAANRRLEAAPDIPVAVARLSATRANVKVAKLPRWQQLCWGRSAWLCLQTAQQNMVVIFVYTHSRRTFYFDASSLLRGSTITFRSGDSLAIDQVWAPLENADFGSVHTVNELSFVGSAMPVSAAEALASSAATGASSAAAAPSASSVVLRVGQARPITDVVKVRRRKGKKRNVDGVAAGSDSDSSAESDERSPECKQKCYSSSDSASSLPSVDTDADSGVEATPDAVLKRIVSVHIEKDMQEPGKKAADVAVHSGSEDSAAGAPGSSADAIARHAPGTWKVWEGTWFYATKTPGFTDVKVIMKQPFRNLTSGMGSTGMSKALSPHHYGEEWENPIKTMILLKCWCIWRARHLGWARQKECRLREVDRQVQRITQEITAEQAGIANRPLLGSVAAEKLMAKWVPDIVSSFAL